MTQKIEVIFDGKVLKPCTPIQLKKNEHYRVLIEIEDKKESDTAWDVLDEMTGSIEAPSDWAKEHDHYLYGIPKNT